MFLTKILGSNGNDDKNDEIVEDDSVLEDRFRNTNASGDPETGLTDHYYSHVQKPHHKLQNKHHQHHHRHKSSSAIEEYRESYANMYLRSSAKKEAREVSEEYDIASNISGLTHESDFRFEELNKENIGPGNNNNKRGGRKGGKKKDMSFINSSIRRLTSVRGRLGRKLDEDEKLSKRRSSRARSYSPDRSQAASSMLSRRSGEHLDRSTAQGYPHIHHRRVPSPPPTATRRSIFDARMESYLLRKKRSKSLDVRNGGRGRRTSPPREPSPSPRRSKTPVLYDNALQDLNRGRRRSSSRGRRNFNKLKSPEPDGTKLEDYAFRASRYIPATATNIDQVEPLGTRLEDGKNDVTDTPLTKDMYVEDSKTFTEVGAAAKHVQQRKAKIYDMYKEFEDSCTVEDVYKGIDAEVAEIEAQLPSLAKHRESEILSNAIDNVPSQTAKISKQQNKDADEVLGPYSAKAKARLRSRIFKRIELSKPTPNTKKDDRPVLTSPHDPPIAAIESEPRQEDISSLIADKSSSFDWKAFANYLDEKEETIPLHRFKYRSLFTSPPKDTKLGSKLVEHSEEAPTPPTEPMQLMRRSRSTGHLLARKWSSAETSSRSKPLMAEYLEFTPRESGGYLQATCFEQSKSTTAKALKEMKTVTVHKELDWMENIANGEGTINHNDSHELNVMKVSPKHNKPGRNTVDGARSSKLPPPSATRSRKDTIRAVTQEAANKPLLSPSDNNDDDSNFDEDLIAGLYPSHEKPTSTMNRQMRRHSQNDVARQLPFVTPSPPTRGKTQGSSEPKIKVDLNVAPKVMSTSQRKKLISDYLSVRDGSVSSSSSKKTPPNPDTPKNDPPESRKMTRARSYSFKPKTTYDAYGFSHYEESPPILGISPRSVMKTHDQVELCDYNSENAMGGKSVKSMSSTIASVKSHSSTRRHEKDRDEGKSCFPSGKLSLLARRHMDSRATATKSKANNRHQHNSNGYDYLPSDASSSAGGGHYTAFSVNVNSVKLPVATPKTTYSKSFSSSNNSRAFGSRGGGLGTTSKSFSSSNSQRAFGSALSRPRNSVVSPSAPRAAPVTPYSVKNNNNIEDDDEDNDDWCMSPVNSSIQIKDHVEEDWYMSPLEKQQRQLEDEISFHRVNL
ncbi:MAG: hypothetical protein SGILL_006989 [Bacillariaceae sp.]